MRAFWFVFTIFISKVAFGQPAPPPVPQSYYPIDVVVGVLLVVGVLWGVRKLKKQPKTLEA
jgi:hypothetical protein